MNNLMKKTLLASAVTIMLGMSASAALAQSYPTFTVSENPALIPGVIPATVTNGDKIIGNYTETITFNGTASSGTFDAALLWNAGSFAKAVPSVSNPGQFDQVGLASQVGQTGSVTPSAYGLYALYKASGNYTASGGITTFNFTSSSTNGLQVFLDPGTDTTFAAPTFGTGSYVATPVTPDILIATGQPYEGQGKLDQTLTTCPVSGAVNATTGVGINCGSFGATSTFVLNDAGKQYFVSPAPFYNLSFQSGQLNNFTPNQTKTINGSLDVVFGTAIPEPTTVALIGLGLLGLGMSRRRNNKA